MPSLNPAYSKLLGASLGSKVFDPLSHEANQSLDNMVGKSKREKALDFIEAFTRERETSPGFGVKIRQPGLKFAVPNNVSDQLMKDYDDPFKSSGVEKFIFNRQVLDQDNPFPIT